jgi:hypothetical protein
VREYDEGGHTWISDGASGEVSVLCGKCACI